MTEFYHAFQSPENSTRLRVRHALYALIDHAITEQHIRLTDLLTLPQDQIKAPLTPEQYTSLATDFLANRYQYDENRHFTAPKKGVHLSNDFYLEDAMLWSMGEYIDGKLKHDLQTLNAWNKKDLFQEKIHALTAMRETFAMCKEARDNNYATQNPSSTTTTPTQTQDFKNEAITDYDLQTKYDMFGTDRYSISALKIAAITDAFQEGIIHPNPINNPNAKMRDERHRRIVSHDSLSAVFEELQQKCAAFTPEEAQTHAALLHKLHEIDARSAQELTIPKRCEALCTAVHAAQDTPELMHTIASITGISETTPLTPETLLNALRQSEKSEVEALGHIIQETHQIMGDTYPLAFQSIAQLDQYIDDSAVLKRKKFQAIHYAQKHFHAPINTNEPLETCYQQAQHAAVEYFNDSNNLEPKHHTEQFNKKLTQKITWNEIQYDIEDLSKLLRPEKRTADAQTKPQDTSGKKARTQPYTYIEPHGVKINRLEQFESALGSSTPTIP